MKKYSKYKDSGIEWLGEIPEHWEAVKLKYLAEVKTGYTPPKTNDENYCKNGVVWVKPDNLNEFIPILNSKERVSEEGLRNNSIIPKGSVLVCCIGSIGKFGVAGVDLITNQQINSLLFNDNVNIEYGKFLIAASQSEHDRNANGNVVKILNRENQKNIFLVYPPLPEQQTIASFLDHKTTQIDNLIEKKEQLVEKLTLKRQAIINEAVTKGLNPNVPMKDSGIEWLGEIPEHWKVVKFRHFFTLNSGLSITKANLIDKGIPCVNYGEIHSQYGFEVNPEKDKLKCVSEDYISTNESALLSYGDFVFADTSEDIKGSGNFTYLNSNTPTIAGYHTIIARLQKSNQFRFFAYQFDSFVFRSQIQVQVKGVKVFSITNKILKETFLLLPPENEKASITKHIDKKVSNISDSIQKLILSIDKLKLYRQSLISEAVTGKIDLRDWEQTDNK